MRLQVVSPLIIEEWFMEGLCRLIKKLNLEWCCGFKIELVEDVCNDEKFGSTNGVFVIKIISKDMDSVYMLEEKLCYLRGYIEALVSVDAICNNGVVKSPEVGCTHDSH